MFHQMQAIMKLNIYFLRNGRRILGIFSLLIIGPKLKTYWKFNILFAGDCCRDCFGHKYFESCMYIHHEAFEDVFNFKRKTNPRLPTTEMGWLDTIFSKLFGMRLKLGNPEKDMPCVIIWVISSLPHVL